MIKTPAIPPKMPKSSKLRVEQEGRILLAILAIKSNKISTVKRAAEVFNVSRSILCDRLKGVSFKGEQRVNGHKLTTSKEELLKKWILSLDKCRVPPRPVYVQEMANILLLTRDTTSPSTTVGEKWVYNFTRYIPEFKSCFIYHYNY